MKRAFTVGIALGMAGLLVSSTLPASAGDDDRDRGRDDDRIELRRSGDCSGRADWELKAKQRDGGLEVEFEVDSNRSRQRWTYSVAVNGATIVSGSRRTTGRSGSFSVERTTAAGPIGTNVVTGRAARAGEVCLATLQL